MSESSRSPSIIRAIAHIVKDKFSMANKTVLRRAPKQERGQRRIARLLDAAAAEFARVGFDAATTNAIARRAKTSVGSLYQFFPNKEAILAALTEYYLTEIRAVQAVVGSDEATRLPPAAFVDQLVERLAEFHATHPAFLSLFYGSPTSPHLAAAAERLHSECVAGAEASIAARLPRLDPARRRLHATMNVQVVKALLPLAAAAGPTGRDQVLAEIKKLLVRYMDGVAAESQA
jgi:AcrR family transcriptional regulator